MEAYPPEKLQEEDVAPVIFLMATHGEGEPTDNAAAFYRFFEEERWGARAGGRNSGTHLSSSTQIAGGYLQRLRSVGRSGACWSAGGTGGPCRRLLFG